MPDHSYNQKIDGLRRRLVMNTPPLLLFFLKKFIMEAAVDMRAEPLSAQR
ncbi:hypothetical protein [Pseudomonas sp. AMR01]